MRSVKFHEQLLDPVVIDNFAGGGGASIGIERGMDGRPVDLAVNHDPLAIEMHRANHPMTEHLCEDVFRVDPRKATRGRRPMLAWFSPDCTHFSRAKGSKPVAKKIRGLAWVAVRWARENPPDVIMIENVREFETWGPLIAKVDEAGRAVRYFERRLGLWLPAMVPDPARMGLTFKRFIGNLRGLGYRVEWRVLNAADYGAPTHRRRLFIVARRDGRAIVWPEATHGPVEGRLGRAGAGVSPHRRCGSSAGQGTLAWGNGSVDRTPGIDAASDQEPAGRNAGVDQHQARRHAYRTAAEVIDWSIPCPSIFDRKKPLAEKTQRRIAMGIKRYVLDNPRPFIVQTGYGERPGQAPRAIDIDKPLGSVVGTGKHAVVAPTFVGVGGADYAGKPRAANEAGGSVMPQDRRAVVAAFLSQFFGGMVGKPLDVPAPTSTGKGPHEGLVALHLTTAHLTKFYSGTHSKGSGGGAGAPTGGNSPCVGTTQGASVEDPLGTVLGQAGKFALVYSFLTKYFGTAIGQELQIPMHTVTGRDRFGVVTVDVDGVTYAIADIGLRMLTPRELARAQGFPDDYILPAVKSRAVKFIGNSVAPPVVEALVRANVGRAAKKSKRSARLTPSQKAVAL